MQHGLRDQSGDKMSEIKKYNEPIDYDINNVFEETYVLQIDGNNIKMSDNLFCIMFYLLENYNEFTTKWKIIEM